MLPTAQIAAARIGVAMVLLYSGPSSAHHSFANYDVQKRLTLAGTVTGFEWMSPHAWLQIQISEPDKSGPMQWNIETPGPYQLSQQGWNAGSLRPGDRVSITLFPLRSGQPGGALLSVVDRAGRVLCARECSVEPSAAPP